MGIERFRGELFAIRKFGVAVYRKAREYGITSVNPAYMKKLQLVLNSVCRSQSASHLLEISEPDFPQGSYLIFCPLVKPENSLTWLNADESQLLNGVSGWNSDTFFNPHYQINPPVEFNGHKYSFDVWGCFDKRGSWWI